ncbi:hypothetical protein GcM1_206048 [Golovinomyces cichoracearum]|uniref:Uncharacterized protein n=1 Tax=Golovinomyces cichoracearum TaxID=62708 RepID=A0A420IWW3_9PEZI|nr:hypothetical protein GcM1_206048 [Golovinomyces cichoracearum]
MISLTLFNILIKIIWTHNNHRTEVTPTNVFLENQLEGPDNYVPKGLAKDNHETPREWQPKADRDR